MWRPLFWVWRCYGLLWLHCPNGRYCDVTMIRPLLFHGMHADLSGSPGTVNTDCQSINHLLDFKAMCCIFTWNVSIYLIGRNCRLDTVLGVFNKWSGLRPSDTLSSWWFRWCCHAHKHKQLFVNSYDSSFQSVTVVVLTYVCLYWIKEYFVVKRLCDTVRQTSHKVSVLSSLIRGYNDKNHRVRYSVEPEPPKKSQSRNPESEGRRVSTFVISEGDTLCDVCLTVSHNRLTTWGTFPAFILPSTLGFSPVIYFVWMYIRIVYL